VVRGLHISAEIRTVDLCYLSFAADVRALHFGREGFAKLMGDHKCGFVLAIQIAREGECGLAFDLVAKDCDGRKIGPQRELMEGE
jgi:hypothetical protein